MPQTRPFLALCTLLLLCAAAAHARQTTEARAAWQVLRYDLSATVNPAERVLTGRAVVSARNVGEGVGRSFTVRLNPAAEVTAARAGDAAATVSSRKDERTNLLVSTLNLPATVQPGGTTSVTVEYRLPVGENSGIAAISPEGAQFLPLSFWYPTPNTVLAPRGADYAPFRVSITPTPGDVVVSAGRVVGDSFDQPLNGQPFFLSGKWDAVTGGASGISAHLGAGAGQEEKQRAQALVALAADARKFYEGLLGPAPDTEIRLVGVRRGAGFEMAGTLLVDHAVFRRTKTDSATALQIAEAVARLWVGGAKGVEGAGAGAVREGLPRFLATLFLEQQFGRDAADKERSRMALLYAPIARRDAPLAETTPALDTYFNTAANKGALVWRIVMNAVGRDFFMNTLRRELAKERAGNLSLASLRAALAEGGGGEAFTQLLAGLIDKPTDTDLLVGLPQRRGAGQAVALRNMGSFDVSVDVQATTDAGQRLTTKARVPAKDFGEAVFQTTAKIVRVEVDPEKFYPQIDYANDVAPRTPAAEESVAEARAQLARNEFARAEATARTALARAPLSEDARVVLARAVLEQNRVDEAEKEFRAALDSPLPSPATLAWANIGLGEIALRRNRAADAAKRFDEAVRTDAEYASTLAARAARIKAETAAGGAPPVDEQIKAAVAQLDTAIRTGRKAEIDAAIVPGELSAFSRGLIGTQPEIWQTRVLRTEQHGASRVAADVAITTRALGRDASGTAVLSFTRTPAGWKLSDIQFFEVR